MQILLLCLLIQAHTVSSHNEKYKIFAGFYNESNRCSSNDLEVPHPNDFRSTVNIAKKENLQHFFVDLKMQQLNSFTHIDGTMLSKGIVVNGNGECGALATSEKYLRGVACNSLWLGYLCSVSEDDCFPSHVNTRHIKVQGSCYEVNMNMVNWFEARWHCQQKGYALAIVKTDTQTRLLKKLIRWEFSEFFRKPDTFWVGFRKIDYYTTYAPLYGPTSYIIATESFWDFWEPQLTSGECVIATLDGDMVYWKTAPCSQTSTIICIETQMKQRKSSSMKTVLKFTKTSISKYISNVRRRNETKKHDKKNSQIWTIFSILFIIVSIGFILMKVIMKCRDSPSSEYISPVQTVDAIPV